MFYDVVERLDPTAFTAHMLDFRGSGLSDRPSDGYDLRGFSSDVRAALAELPARVELVAHSMGGKIAQFVALDPPANLKGLVLVAPGTARGAAPHPTHRALALGAFGSRTNIERFLRAAMYRDIAPDALEHLIDDALVASREAWFDWYDRGRLEDFSDGLRSISIPTLVIAGERDPLMPPQRLRRDVSGAIPGAVLVTLRHVGHNIPVELPGELASVIAQHRTS